MSFGTPSEYQPWTLDDDAAQSLFRQALDLGITFWDTANVYGGGTSEEIVGRAIQKLTTREEIVLATKVFMPMHEGPGGSGLSRKAILEQVDASLRRLDTAYVDLLQIHRFDPDVSVEETMEALHDVVQAAETHGWTKFVSMQDQYSLLAREEEREMFGLLADQGVGSMPWSPLAAGKVTRRWGETGSARAQANPDVDMFGRSLWLDSDKAIVDTVERIATEREVSMATVAMAWVLRNPVVDSPIIGATKPHHLADAVAALDIVLTDDEVAALEAPYVPRTPTYFN
jgi:aryl-alcohol dehydrogenase-like predicted oxidoreductase